jgi:hypothetical protein
MGAWNTHAFGNDTACDWAGGLAQTDDLSLVEAAIAAVVDSTEGDLDASLAQEALAAAEVLARLRGHADDCNAYTEAADEWVQAKRLTPPQALIRSAVQAVECCLGQDSELRELWDESESSGQWHAEMQSLKERLLAEPRPLAPPIDPVHRAVSEMVIVGHLVRGLLLQWDEAGGLPAGALLAEGYKCVLAGDATGRPDIVLEATSRVARAATALGKTPMLQDLAVRDARILFREGRIDDALAGLAPWRRVTSPEKVDARLPGLYMAADDLDTTRRMYEEAKAREPGQLGPRIDSALLEARLGPVTRARSLIDEVGDMADTDLQRSFVALIRGIVAHREGSADAIAYLLPVLQEYLGKAMTGAAAAWPILAYCAGWSALALERTGRAKEAHALATLAEPLLVVPGNRKLVADLVAAGLLPVDAETRAVAPRPSAPPRPEDGVIHRSTREVMIAGEPSQALIELHAAPPRMQTRHPSDAPVDHGAFQTVAVRGINAMALLHSLRQDFSGGSGCYPFLIGDESDLDRLLHMITPPADGGQAILKQAAQLDVGSWVAAACDIDRQPECGTSDQDEAESLDQPSAPCKVLQTPYDPLERLKPLQFIGLCQVSDPAEVFARLGYGGWNECPAPHVHVALHRQWRQHVGAELAALQADVVECTVQRAPLAAARKAAPAVVTLPSGKRIAVGANADALQDAFETSGAVTLATALAEMHAAYCPDTIDQGPNDTLRKLAASLLESTCWTFWWD